MTTNPQLEEGFTRVSNELIEALARVNFSAYETRVFWYLLRKTYGYQKKTDAISLSQFAAGTGMSTSSVSRTLNRLQNRNLITKNKDFHINEYGINKHYDQWDTTIDLDTITTASVYPDSSNPDSSNPDNEVLSNQTIGTVYPDNKTLANQTVTKERKILSKDTIQKKVSTAVKVETCFDVFMAFKKNERYNGIDFENDFQKMCKWYNGNKKKVKLPELACHNWLDKTLARLQKDGNNGKGSNGVNYPVPKVAPDPDREAVKADLIRQMEEKT